MFGEVAAQEVRAPGAGVLGREKHKHAHDKNTTNTADTNNIESKCEQQHKQRRTPKHWSPHWSLEQPTHTDVPGFFNLAHAHPTH